MSRYIDADRLKEYIAKYVYPLQDDFNSRDYGMFWTSGIERCIDEMPSVQTERKKGKWIDAQYPFSRCNICECYFDTENNLANFCPNCGADMRGEEDDT